MIEKNIDQVSDFNYNEKTNGEGKSNGTKTKLSLKKETIRELKDSDLKVVMGGAATTTSSNG